MFVTLASVKGSPGVTSLALALAAVWPRPVVLLEADLDGGDLGYRARAAHGGPIAPHRGLLRLASAVRGGPPRPDAVSSQAQLLACGVSLVQGVSAPAQTRGMGSLWPLIAQACLSADVDVIADLGRLDRTSALLPLAQASEVFLPVAAASLESVMHLSDGLQDLIGGLTPTLTQASSQGPGLGPGQGPTRQTTRRHVVRVLPILVGPEAHGAADCADLDEVLTRFGMPTEPTMPIPYDARALQRLEQGERPDGRLGRTLLLRATKAVATAVVGETASQHSGRHGGQGAA